MTTEQHLIAIVESVAQAIHDDEMGRGSWDDYGCWTINTDTVHEEYRSRARAALDAIPGLRLEEQVRVTYRHDGRSGEALGPSVDAIVKRVENVGLQRYVSAEVLIDKVERQMVLTALTPWITDRTNQTRSHG
ncbi:hypothetical protein SAMN06295974_3834 [Plantibacter flavus]|uniref:Uncharacterized protein n=1 Tax=Plantibacter flavus TaxID=150123 RepID=A0A3N2BL77_9MICO|nr:hypothetical protein [Plantibacter flavus]ROR76020.1 hypothetical protein EDD42_3972 [Plantibacter flavus]SMG49252.1 hypothetical protein SAMN06295974_3834 [Plantibacter flavus]